MNEELDNKQRAKMLARYTAKKAISLIKQKEEDIERA